MKHYTLNEHGEVIAEHDCPEDVPALRAQLEELHKQDRLKTREINTLIPENRALLARLRDIVETWNDQSGRVFECMGNENPRAQAIDEAVARAAELIKKTK